MSELHSPSGGISGGNPASFLSQVGGLRGTPGGPTVNQPPFPNPLDPGNPIYRGFAGINPFTGQPWGLPNPADPGNPIYQGVAGIGDAAVKAAGDGLTDFWRRSGATISVLLVGVGLVAIALLRTETVQTALAGSTRAAAL